MVFFEIADEQMSHRAIVIHNEDARRRPVFVVHAAISI
jgi:hypothetical protein